MTLSLRGRVAGLSGVPQHWRGPMPDVSIRRDLPALGGYAQVPMEVLFGGHADLAVVTWAWLRLRSDDRANVASYQQFADALGYAHLTPKAAQKRFSAALGSLLDNDAPLGRWLERERTLDNQQLYRAVVPAGTGKRWAMLRRSDLALLTLPAARKAARPVSVADLADLSRWQLECGQRGWTADSLSAIAARWRVSEPTLWRGRARLETVGLLKVIKRAGGRYPDLVWLAELHDPSQDPISVVQVYLPKRTRLVDRPGGVDTEHLDEGPAEPLARLRGGWWARRTSAVRRLKSGLTQLSIDDAWWRPHEVYLIHFPDERRYKIGLTLVGSQRIAHLTASRPSVVVDRVAVGSRFVAEMIEVDVLTAIEPWHELGDPHRKGGGYTEMWSDAGPSVDLASFVAAATSEVARLLTRSAETP